MADGFFDLGRAILGADVDREGARLEGLNVGTQIQQRRAATENAMAQAKLRRDELLARNSLADDLEAGGELAVATTVRAGGNPQQVIEAFLGQQELGFRDTIADPNVPFGTRQASAQAIEGKVVDPIQFGPGGELFVDVFSDQPAVNVTPTGTAQIAADEALTTDRLADAALAEEKRLHPERFKSGITINTGSGLPLGDAILADVGDTSTLPDDIKPEEATGVAGFGRSLANAAFDVVNADLPYPDADKATNALSDLLTRTQIVSQQAVPGRPSNYLMQQLAAFGVSPNDPFKADQRTLTRLEQTERYLAGEVDGIRRILNGGRVTPTQLGNYERAIRSLEALRRDYAVAISRFNAEDTLPEGWTAEQK
tara:strand:+ start:853 stop:1959 length:1107 start_codon:yes stop_codon:yes gene_type:complete